MPGLCSSSSRDQIQGLYKLREHSTKWAIALALHYFWKKTKFSPATGISPSSRRLASWTLPLTIWYFIEGRPQTEQVEGFITFITQDQLVIFTCKDRDHTTPLAAQQTLQHRASLLVKIYFYLCPCMSEEAYATCVQELVKQERALAGFPGTGFPVNCPTWVPLKSSKHLWGVSPRWPGTGGSPDCLPNDGITGT